MLKAAGIAPPVDPEAVAEIAGVRRGLGAVAVNAALMRHAEGRSHDEVRDYLVDVALMTPERAEKRLSFIEHALWRTYVFVYSEGEALLERWLETGAGGGPARTVRAAAARAAHPIDGPRGDR